MPYIGWFVAKLYGVREWVWGKGAFLGTEYVRLTVGESPDRWS